MNRKKKVEKTEITKNKKYYSFNFRLITSLFLFLVLLLVSIFLLKKTFVVEKQKVINYSEQSNLDYKVYLKENEFYEKEYLTKNMVYVASLIDNITIDFNYNFAIEEPLDLNFDYEIIGKLVISDENDKNIYYEKIYNLSDKKNTILKENNMNIQESIVINYDEYNKISNSFKNSYGLNTTSKLLVYLSINKDVLNNKDNKFSMMNGNNNILVNIPLSEKAVNISVDYKDINNQSYILDNTKVLIDNIICLVLAIISLVLSLVFLIKSMRLISIITNKKDIYDEYINKILNEYDRLIVETSTSPFSEEEKIVKVDKFTELLDVRDNLKQPIMYYVVSKHNKCYFYINANNGRIYLTTIKRVDLEEENEKH